MLTIILIIIAWLAVGAFSGRHYAKKVYTEYIGLDYGRIESSIYATGTYLACILGGFITGAGFVIWYLIEINNRMKK